MMKTRTMRFGKTVAIAICTIVCMALLSACEDEKKSDWSVYIPSMIVANGDYLTSSVYGESDYDFKVKYYWDGTLIETTGKDRGLNYLISNQTAGDHILKVVFEGEAKGEQEFYIQVYNKELGFFGCNLVPSNREVRNGESLQGTVFFFPGTREYSATGKMENVKIWIDGELVQTVTSAPFSFEIKIQGLSQGKHKLTLQDEGVLNLPGLVGGSLGGVAATLPVSVPVYYEFTVK